MIIHHSNRLHERIADGRADEFQAALTKIAAQPVGLGREDLYVRAALSSDRLAVNESPHVSIEAAELLLNCQESLSVPNRGVDLQSVADDASVSEKFCDSPLIVFRDLARIEVVERDPIIVALAQNRFPTQPGLRAFEDQKLEERAIVMNAIAPLAIVIGDRQFSTRPMTAVPW